MTVGQLGMKHPSLAGMVEAIKVSISREGMHRRFTGTAVAFMRRCAEFVLKQKASEMIRIQSKILQHVKRILIVDSTSWDINQALMDVLPGYGGGASDAKCNVQACYEYKSGELAFFAITAGTVPDNAYTTQLTSHLHKGDLVLFDLGYFCTKTLRDINRFGAYFLCRFFVGTALLDPVTLMGDFHQMKVLMGSQHRGLQVVCRLVCLKVPQEIANERRRKIRKTIERKKKREPSKYYLQMADWTLMVTNAPEGWLPPEMARPSTASDGRSNYCLSRSRRFCAYTSPIPARKIACFVKYTAS